MIAASTIVDPAESQRRLKMQCEGSRVMTL
jgi:hypothetical protein